MSLTYGFCLDELSSTYNSKQFSDAFHALFGNGISEYGAKFSATINGFTITLSPGYALAAGRWAKSDELISLSVSASGDNEDRTDAVAVWVDYEARKATLQILANIDPEKLRTDPAALRNEDGYGIVLYFIRVRRGATAITPDDITDVRADSELCGTIIPLSAVAVDVLHVYDFLTSGVDLRVAEIINQSEQTIQKTDAKIAELNATILSVGGTAEIGELRMARKRPEPSDEWVLCDGSTVPAEYPALYSALGGVLPSISSAEDRYRTYIYGGEPKGV